MHQKTAFIIVLAAIMAGPGAHAQPRSPAAPFGVRQVAAPPSATNLAYPQSVFVDSRDGQIWVADFDNHRILRFDASSLTSVDDSPASLAPEAFHLAQNYPNPFNPGTTIAFALGSAGPASVKVYDVLGREVATLFDGPAAARTRYTLSFDATGLPGGVYFYTIRSAAGNETRKMGVIK